MVDGENQSLWEDLASVALFNIPNVISIGLIIYAVSLLPQNINSVQFLSLAAFPALQILLSFTSIIRGKRKKVARGLSITFFMSLFTTVVILKSLTAPPIYDELLTIVNGLTSSFIIVTTAFRKKIISFLNVSDITGNVILYFAPTGVITGFAFIFTWHVARLWVVISIGHTLWYWIYVFKTD